MLCQLSDHVHCSSTGTSAQVLPAGVVRSGCNISSSFGREP